MSNNYYNNPTHEFNPHELTDGAKIDDEFAAIEAAFTALEEDLGSLVDDASSRKIKSAAETRTSTTLAADGDIAGFVISAAGIYFCKGLLWIAEVATYGAQFKGSVQFSETPVVNTLGFRQANGTYTQFRDGATKEDLASSSVQLNPYTNQGGLWAGGNLVIFEGIVIGHATNDGTMDFMWSAYNSGGYGGIKLFEGSFIQVKKVSD